MSALEILTILEEVRALVAVIESDLPFAHFAAHQAALATSALETALVSFETSSSLDISEIANIRPLRILRIIATTKTETVEPIEPESDNDALLWLRFEPHNPILQALLLRVKPNKLRAFRT